MIYFTSDLHFGHQREFLYGPRGFSSIGEHDTTIITNWNSIVKPEDRVYALGDIMLNDDDYGQQCFNQLNGEKYIILGNHDTLNRQQFYEKMNGVVGMAFADMIQYYKWNFFLCHYPTLVKNLEEKTRFFCLHGHTHSNDRFQFINNSCYNVSLDAHDNKPVAIDEIIEDLRQRKMEL